MKIGSIKPHIVSLNQFWREEAQSLHIPTIQRQFVWDAEEADKGSGVFFGRKGGE